MVDSRRPRFRPAISNDKARLESTWWEGFERRLLHLISLGGLATGLAVALVGPPGFDGTDVLSLLALGIGIGGLGNLLFNKTDPVPVLVVVVVLVGLVTPFIDLATAMALSAVVVGVVATGSLLIERLEGAIALMALGLVVIAIRPVLDWIGFSAAFPAGDSVEVAWIVALIALLATALAFRALRDQLIREDEHQKQVNETVENTACQIKGPLAAALGYAYLLRAELPAGEAADYADGVIKRAWEASLGLDDLMFVTRAETTDLDLPSKTVELEPVINRCLDDVIGARVKLRHLSVDGAVLGDPVRVRQIIRHLVTNASIHGGASMSILGRRRGSNYVVHVRDSGAPLKPEEIDRMFEPFVKLRLDDVRAGRGVGLSVSRILATAMGGDLRFESSPEGNTAILTLRSASPNRVRRMDTLRLRQKTDPNPV